MMTDADLFNRNFKAIPIGSLVENSTPKFDIYLKQANEFVLFASSHTKIFPGLFEVAETSGLDVVYIKRDQADLYEEYSIEMIEASGQKDAIILETKSKVLYATAKNVMHRLFDSDFGKKEVESAKLIARDLLNQITSDKKAFLSLVRISTHDYYTYTHSINVCMYSVAIGERLGLAKEELRILAEGSLLHDIGKTMVEQSIINKNSKLNQAEFEAVKPHPTFGCEMLAKNGEIDQRILNIIAQHHEKLNGTGYPLGLRRDSIGRLSQIVTVADVFDALTTKRSYKDAISTFEAFSIMHTRMKEELNMDILNVFIANFKA